ncbi:hypothetical protein OTR29_01940 [Rickettsia endosymbiont of Halotydeus destructor]
MLIQKGAEIDLSVMCKLAITYNKNEALKLINFMPDKLQSFFLSLNYSNIIGDIVVDENISNGLKKQTESFRQGLVYITEQAKVRENYYKLILGKEYHLLSKVIREQQEFVNNKIFQLNSATYDNDTKEEIIENVLYVISEAINIHKIFKFNTRKKLEDSIIEILEKNKKFSKYFSEKLVSFCLNLMKETHNTGKYLESIKYAKLIEENLEVIEVWSEKNKSNFLRELGLVYSNSDFLKGLDYLSKAELLASDDNIVINKYNIYLDHLKDYNAAFVEAEKITDSDLKLLTIMFTYKKILIPQNISAFNDILLKYNFDKLSPEEFKNDTSKTKIYYSIQAQIHQNAEEHQLARNIYDKQLDQAIVNNKTIWFYEVMYDYLLSFLDQKDWSNGCKFLSKIYKKYPNILNTHNILALKALEFFFFNQDEKYLAKSDEILANIKKEMLSDEKWTNFIQEAYLDKLYSTWNNQKTKENLPIYIKNIKGLYEYSLNNSNISAENIEKLSNLLKFGTVIQNLIKSSNLSTDRNLDDSTHIEKPHEKEIEIIESSISNIILQEPFMRALPKAPKIGFESIEELIKAEDYVTLAQHQKQVFNYFKFKKAELQQQQIQEFFGIKKSILWHAEEGEFSSESEEVVKINSKKNLYAVIDPKLSNTLDPITHDIFVKALHKEEVDRAKGLSGIKYFFSDSIAELKSLSLDLRLYASKTYYNGKNELIVFNKAGNHDAISRVAHEKMQHIDVSGYDDPVSVTGDYSLNIE